MKITPAKEIKDLIIFEPKVLKDDRGFFMETYKESLFNLKFVQDNQSESKKHVFRGIHFQYAPKAQGKLVRCIKGSIIDYAIDLRPTSPTFKKVFHIFLSEENKKMLWIPEGFGHAFISLEDNSNICYKCTNEYDPKCDGGINIESFKDDILYPILGTLDDIIISDKDKKLPSLEDIYPLLGKIYKKEIE